MPAPRHKLCITLFTVLLLALFGATAGLATQSYDDLCDSMISMARSVAAAHNSGDHRRAEELSAKVNDLYQAAVKKNPEEPQAHLNLAVFLKNTQKYEAALEVFELAMSHLDATAVGSRNAVMKMMDDTKYDMYSMKRDAAYDNAKGDVSEAYKWAQLQLSAAHGGKVGDTQLAIATLSVMLCEYNESYCTSAIESYQTAVESAQRSYSMSRLQIIHRRKVKITPDLANACMGASAHLADWSALPPGVFSSVAVSDSLLSQARVSELKGPLDVLGRDPVIGLRDPRICDLMTVEADPLSSGFGAAASAEYSAAKPIKKALLLTQFASHAFYHWMCEVLPRLAVARRSMAEDEFRSMALLVPASTATGGTSSFVSHSLKSLLRPFVSSNEIVPHWKHTAVSGKVVAVTWPMQACPAVRYHGETQPPIGSERAPVCVSLADPTALRLAREDLHEALRSDSSMTESRFAEPYVLLSSRGSDTTMRNYDESALFHALRSGLKDMEVDIRLFDSSAYNLTAALRLFRGAIVVVGMHGASLSNIMACENGTEVVEIGFKTIGAQQYAHVAHALGLPFTRVPVSPDPLHRSLAAPDVTFDTAAVIDAVRDAVTRSLAAAGPKGATPSSGESIEIGYTECDDGQSDDL